MNLEQLLKFIASKKQEFRESISAAAEELTFEEVRSQIKLDPSDFEICGRYSETFKDGQTIEFIPQEARYHISIDKHELTLEASYGVLFKRFTGEKVRTLYDELSAQIKKIQEEQELLF